MRGSGTSARFGEALPLALGSSAMSSLSLRGVQVGGFWVPLR